MESGPAQLVYIHSWVYRIPEKLGKKTVMEPWPLPRASVCPTLGWDLTAFSLSITLEMSISITHWPREYECLWPHSLLSVWVVTCSGLSSALRAHKVLLWLGTMLQYLFLPHGDLTNSFQPAPLTACCTLPLVELMACRFPFWGTFCFCRCQ